MSLRTHVSTTFEPARIIEPIYTGGDVAVDYNGSLVVTCLGEDALITDLRSGKLLARIGGDGEDLTTLLITPSASHLIACSRSLSMRIYTLQKSEDDSKAINAVLIRTIKPHTTPVVTATTDRTGSLLATGGADGVVKVWDIRGGYVSHTFRGHAGVVSALHFFESRGIQQAPSKDNRTQNGYAKQSNGLQTPDQRTYGFDTATSFHLASGSEDGKIRIWDLSKGKSIASLDSHVSVVRSIDYSPQKNAVLSASRDKTVIIWDASNWMVRKVIPILERVESAGFSNQGTFFYTGGENGKLRMWSTESGREITQEQIAGTEGDEIVSILSNDSLRFLICVHADQSLVLHDIKQLEDADISTVEPLPVVRRISGTHDEIIDLAYAAPDRALLALATNSESIRLVSLADQENVLTKDLKIDRLPFESSYFGADVALLQGHEDIIICLDVDWSGCWLATGAKDNTARLWQIDHANNSYKGVATFSGHAESLGAIALPSFIPQLGSAAQTNPLAHLPTFLLTGSQDKTVKRWDTTAKRTTTADKKSPRALYTRKAHDKDINALAVNHDSSLFASASQDKTVKIWSVEEGEVQGVLRGHRRGVWSVKFAPKETPAIMGENGPTSSNRGTIVTGSGDKTVRIWSLADYSCLRTLEGHTNSVLKVLWMPLSREPRESDGPNPTVKHDVQIASAGGDGLVKVWDANTGEVECTLDNHTDRIWALAVDPETNTLVSGGGDSVVTFWKDTTSITVAESAAKSTARVEQEQQLQNYIHRSNYREAITLALQLNHPARLLSLFTNVVNTSPPEAGSMCGVKAVDDVLTRLGDDQLFTLLLRVRDWNTNARTAPVAQKILWILVKSYPATKLSALKGGGNRGGPDAKDVFDALKAYTERHYKRMEELIDESYIVDYTLREMEEVGFVDQPLNGDENDMVSV
ncbi:U3 small nucleolar RNA-associated protein 13 [Bachmanniomyces sp. S44760]|nr:U3 small nucleolar RNA-associated protein 13 [Bachmanniomyces sp. S44760]